MEDDKTKDTVNSIPPELLAEIHAPMTAEKQALVEKIRQAVNTPGFLRALKFLEDK